MSQNIHFSRTKESTLFEVGTALLLLVGLGPCLFLGDKETIVIALCHFFAVSFVCFILLALAYNPSSDFIHIGIDLRHCNLTQWLLVARLLRAMALEIALFDVGISFSSLFDTDAMATTISLALVVVLLGTIVYYVRRIKKAGGSE